MTAGMAATLTLQGCAAGPPVDSKPVRYSFDCDAPGGRYSVWERSLDSTSVQLAGKIRLAEPRVDVNWFPTASILLEDKNHQRVAGLRLNRDPRKTDTLVARVMDSGKGDQEVAIGSSPWSGRNVSFALTLTGTAQLTATYDGVPVTITLSGFSPASVAFGCSTGDFKFDAVTVEEKAGPTH